MQYVYLFQSVSPVSRGCAARGDTRLVFNVITDDALQNRLRSHLRTEARLCVCCTAHTYLPLSVIVVCHPQSTHVATCMYAVQFVSHVFVCRKNPGVGIESLSFRRAIMLTTVLYQARLLVDFADATFARPLRILSDIDDTLVHSGYGLGGPKYSPGTILPGFVALVRVLEVLTVCVCMYVCVCMCVNVYMLFHVCACMCVHVSLRVTSSISSCEIALSRLF